MALNLTHHAFAAYQGVNQFWDRLSQFAWVKWIKIIKYIEEKCYLTSDCTCWHFFPTVYMFAVETKEEKITNNKKVRN